MSLRELQEEYEYLGSQNITSKRYYSSAATRLQERKSITTYSFMKRMLDIILSLAGIIFLIPLFIIVAICIKVEDPGGSVFFKQNRVGKDETLFPMYKFRSMVSNAEALKQQLMSQNEVEGAMFKMKNDPRVTRVGKLLRKTSIDEMPQLWNVLIGDMSLVGPRPALPSEVSEYTSYEKKRLTVTPGCTGLWQVSGRSNLSFEQMVELDLTYIRERSVFYDLKIMTRTVSVLLGSKDAF
ncbi:sugar transferase [Paenibacillus aceris]|uniref:Lipopolysaccharide/colanic/teichoic acid biosynthesis glycosyltransferase n=1 Tax=Paenibacillus aceris TaxID=869555 RepID=A0ABS4HX69_9BACL|nr:sugar transferase [Paenibacillus aceris]MBP1962951.1 lipopolysaccharide/colanic/teichoic acid biosynthesis glycosyltransferase [Paenibacillus aceris]NHW38377.1 sugar transferase [Paenibacillus aceris]